MLDRQPTIVEKLDAQDTYCITGGEIRIENVHFSYLTGETTLLNVDFTVPAGKTVALVGMSGAGKSTVLNLIPRFYDIEIGKISIDGIDVRNVTLNSLRGAIALVSQDITLFDDTIRSNIAYGRPDASEDEIVSAAKNASAHEFIMSMPNGYNTYVGERGTKVSGGQRQRLAIARAMLKNAPILLLDEATSALDTESERNVQLALSKLMKDRTTLVIAHRLSTIMDADLIHVIDEGTIKESGSHAELMEKKGIYERLYQMQFGNNDSLNTTKENQQLILGG